MWHKFRPKSGIDSAIPHCIRIKSYREKRRICFIGIVMKWVNGSYWLGWRCENKDHRVHVYEKMLKNAKEKGWSLKLIITTVLLPWSLSRYLQVVFKFLLSTTYDSLTILRLFTIANLDEDLARHKFGIWSFGNAPLTTVNRNTLIFHCSLLFRSFPFKED